MSGSTSNVTKTATSFHSGNRYFANPMHEEALARLRYLIGNHHRLGLLLGAAGSGKTLVLQALAQTLSRQGHLVVFFSLLGRDNGDFLDALATGLGCFPDDNASAGSTWRAITERLRENRYQQRPTVVLLDDADEAEMDVLTSVTRLVQTELIPPSNLTVITSAHQSRRQLLGPRLKDLCELRIELEPWTQDEVEEFVGTHLQAAGRFDTPAIQRLWEISGGVPRRVSHLAELALLAGAGFDTPIDAEMVESAYRELSPQSRPQSSALGAQEGFSLP